MRRIVPIFLAVCLATAAAAEGGTIELRISTQVLEVGEAVEVQLVCTDTGRPGAPTAVVPDGLEIELTNAIPREMSSMHMINGQVTKWTEYTYPMRLTALQAGTYTLGPVSIEAGGQTYSTDPIRIEVKEVDASAGPQGDQYIFAELEVEPRSLYITESYAATLTIGIRKVEIQGQAYEMDLLRQVLDVRGSQLSIFADGRAGKSERWLTGSSGRRHKFEVFKVSKTIRAEEVGPFRVGPIFLKANYPTSLRRGFGFFNRLEVARARKETARAEAIIVEVRAPPEEGKPDDFAGAVGKYRMDVTAKPTRVEQGKPVTLAISISGTPIEGIAGPDLARHAEIASRFDYTKDELVGDIERGRKVFRRAIFPKQAGEQTIPPISWSYFHPQQERYVTLTSKPVILQVDPPSGGSKAIALDGGEVGANGTSLTVLTGGISPNFVGADLVLADQSFVFTRSWTASLAAPPVLWLLITLTARRRARLRGDVSLARRRRASRRARASLSHALGMGQPDQQWSALADAVKDYLSDRFNLPPGELTPQEARILLVERGADNDTANQVADFLDLCNAARYAPGAVGEMSPRRAAGSIRDWIRRIERTTR